MKLSQSILYTLAYSAQFDWPLTREELWRRLPGRALEDAQTSFHVKLNTLHVKRGGFEAELHQLFRLAKIQTSGDYCFLPGRRQDLPKRILREAWSQEKRRQAELFLRLLRALPWIRAIFITGSVATKSARPNDDLDFCIITAPGRLWLARPLVTLLAFLWGRARLRGFHGHNSWCLNMWLEDDSLALEAQNLYTAYELCQADCVFDRGGVAAQWLRANSWVGEILPNWYGEKIGEADACVDSDTDTDLGSGSESTSELQSAVVAGALKTVFDALGRQILNSLNHLAFKLQYSYMRSHQTIETVEYKRAFFHPRATSEEMLRGWTRECLQLKR